MAIQAGNLVLAGADVVAEENRLPGTGEFPRIADDGGVEALLTLPGPGSPASLGGSKNLVLDEDIAPPSIVIRGAGDSGAGGQVRQFIWQRQRRTAHKPGVGARHCRAPTPVVPGTDASTG